jgi:hypothetical protein
MGPNESANNFDLDLVRDESARPWAFWAFDVVSPDDGVDPRSFQFVPQGKIGANQAMKLAWTQRDGHTWIRQDGPFNSRCNTRKVLTIGSLYR